MNKRQAQIEYSMIKAALIDYCQKNTDFEPEILEERYPFRVRYRSTVQLQLSDDGGTRAESDGDLVVIVGLSSKVKSTLTFRIDAKLLKKLIKLAENAALVYYHAFREAADNDSRIADQEEAQYDEA